MIGYKQVDLLTLEECFDILTCQLGHPLYDDVKIRFAELVSDLSFKKSYDFLKQHNNCKESTFYQLITSRYDKLSAECREQEGYGFRKCQTILDYERFIKQYESMAPFYNAVYINDARLRISELQKAKDIEALNTIRRKKRTRWIVAGSVIVVLLTVLSLSYKPVWNLEAEDVFFDKEGGTKEIRITTNADQGAIEVNAPQNPWLDVKTQGKRITLNAARNEVPERSCTIDIITYPTFFGEKLYSRKVTKTVIVSQESGFGGDSKPNQVPTSASNNSIDLAQLTMENKNNNTSSDSYDAIADIVETCRKLSESNDYSMVYQLYAPKVARYYNSYDTTVDYVYECYKKYDKKFGVNERHSKIRWESLKYEKTSDGYSVTYVMDYSIDRNDKSKYSNFVLEMHLCLDENYRITSVYEVQLDKY